MNIDIKNAVNNLLMACDSIKKHSSGDVSIKSIDELVIVDILTFIEYAGGILLEVTFNRVFWDYSNHKYHFGKYVALDISLIWGICSIVLIYLVKPWMDKIVNKIPKWVTYLLCILFIIDIICTYAFKSKI